MRRWRRLLWALTAFSVLIGTGGAVLFLRRPQPRISEANYERIRVGMTLEEVEPILGCPPGNYAPEEDLLPIDMWAYGEEKRQSRAPYKEWAADTEPPKSDSNGDQRHEALAIRVWHDEQGRIIDKCRMGYSYGTLSLKNRIREWLKKAKL